MLRAFEKHGVLCVLRASLASREIHELVKNVCTHRIKALICKMILNKKNGHKVVIFLVENNGYCSCKC